ncbi:endonuclease [Noviherbaspirillum sp. CPCC 100848]|uniref:Excinuclease cho n=1 Tax=Noviherbaspirillum album TaxID=3080276 RepID=A0ABU6J9D6_9BURK|nr:endonuclease [Noviherbaspirillum sp. CPCC 100848]MEC4720048.1 endonuclease [Noviherbaspirillum sp. CPCC 100848]
MRIRTSSVGFLMPQAMSRDKALSASLIGIEAANLEALPQGAGIYRFLDAAGKPLYIGKSVNIRSRVQAHFRTPQERALLRKTRRIDFVRMAGEAGALLLESQLIKHWQPPYNVLLKSAAPAYSLHLPKGSFQPQLVDYDDARFSAHGLFASRRNAEAGWKAQIRRHGLCPSLLGLEQTTHGRACFAHQLGHCRGACIGLETPLAHTRRLRKALKQLDQYMWPYAGPIGIHESDGQLQQVHVIDRWAYLGSLSECETGLRLPGSARLDIDTFKILSARLAAGLLVQVDLQITDNGRGIRNCTFQFQDKAA